MLQALMEKENRRRGKKRHAHLARWLQNQPSVILRRIFSFASP
jgi:hypothetical protein